MSFCYVNLSTHEIYPTWTRRHWFHCTLQIMSDIQLVMVSIIPNIVLSYSGILLCKSINKLDNISNLNQTTLVSLYSTDNVWYTICSAEYYYSTHVLLDSIIVCYWAFDSSVLCSSAAKRARRDLNPGCHGDIDLFTAHSLAHTHRAGARRILLDYLLICDSVSKDGGEQRKGREGDSGCEKGVIRADGGGNRSSLTRTYGKGVSALLLYYF